MKKVLFILSALLLSTVSSLAQQRYHVDWSSVTVLASYKSFLNYETRLSTVQEKYARGNYKITECFGYAYIPIKGSHLGVLLFHDGQMEGQYFAYDLECPRCKDEYNRRSRIKMVNTICAYCESCHSQYENVSNGDGIETNMRQRYSLIRYNVYRKGDWILITDR